MGVILRGSRSAGGGHAAPASQLAGTEYINRQVVSTDYGEYCATMLDPECNEVDCAVSPDRSL